MSSSDRQSLLHYTTATKSMITVTLYTLTRCGGGLTWIGWVMSHLTVHTRTYDERGTYFLEIPVARLSVFVHFDYTSEEEYMVASLTRNCLYPCHPVWFWFVTITSYSTHHPCRLDVIFSFFFELVVVGWDTYHRICIPAWLNCWISVDLSGDYSLSYLLSSSKDEHVYSWQISIISYDILR